MRTLIILPLLLVSCSPSEKTEPKVVDAASPVGLYQRADVSDLPSRICIKGEGADMRFGLNSSHAGPENCTAKGRVRANGSTLNLIIDGEPACAVTATVKANGLMLNPPAGAECRYYCGRNVGLDGGPFHKVGNGGADARRAVDMVGEPLC